MQEIITLEPGKIIIILFYRLEHFFREAYALTFGLKPGEKRKFEEVTSDVIMVMRTTLSKKEFASALGMKEGDYFIFFCLRVSADILISLEILSCHLHLVLLSFLSFTMYSNFSYNFNRYPI